MDTSRGKNNDDNNNNNNSSSSSSSNSGNNNKQPHNIQLLHNQLRLNFYALVNFDKIFREYRKMYREKVINQLFSSIDLGFLFDEKTALYIISKKDVEFGNLSEYELKLLLFNNKKISRKRVYLTSQETYYKIKAIKLLIKTILDYDTTLKEYQQYLQHKIQSLIINQKNFRDSYDYMLNLIYSNGNEYNSDFENLLEEYDIM